MTRPRLASTVALVAALVSVAALAGLFTLESNDEFCASCHLPPEETFVARAAAPSALDLASAHAQLTSTMRLRCVDCHGGPGIDGRLHGLAVAAGDAVSWLRSDFVVIGTRYAPIERVRHPIDDALCAACHQETLARPDFENHFHEYLSRPERPPELRCVSCHDGHTPHEGEPNFVTDDGVAPGCAACHQVMGGPSVGDDGR